MQSQGISSSDFNYKFNIADENMFSLPLTGPFLFETYPVWQQIFISSLHELCCIFVQYLGANQSPYQ